MKYDFRNLETWSFSARITYGSSNRTFAMDLNREYQIDVEESSWAPIGGPVVAIYANDGKRDVNVAFGIEKFVATFAGAIERFCNLEIDYPKIGDTASEELESRNQFMRRAVERYPGILMEIARTLKKLTEITEEASGRIAAVRVATP
jgi:hypothetical protein